VHGPRLDGRFEWWDLWFTHCSPRVQLQVVVQRDGLFPGVRDEGDADLNFEFTPPAIKSNKYDKRSTETRQACVPSLSHLERWFVHV
jgi:hypothetical protein